MPEIFDERRLVGIQAERVTNISSTDFPGHHVGEDHSWNLKKFKKKLKVKVQRLSQHSIEFDIVGVDTSIANAFRRIMMAEIPTICIEHVFIWNNTSLIQDEVLANRIGLVPLNIDPGLMEMRGPNDQPTDRNTVIFKIDFECTRINKAPRGSTDPNELYVNSELKSSDIRWQPAGMQSEVFATNPPAPTNKNIVLAKLRPGQQMEMEMHAIKGVGKDHAKFSPVATASYRFLPHIKITKPIPPHLAENFQQCFSPGVISIDPKTKLVRVDEEGVRKDSVSREVLRHPEFVDSVELSRVRDYFLFNVESEGPYSPERLLPEAIKVMREKLAIIKKAAESLKERPTMAVVDNDIVMADSELSLRLPNY